MRFGPKKVPRQRLVDALLFLLFLSAGLSFVWKGPGSNLSVAQRRSAILEDTIEIALIKAEERNRAFLEGEDGELVRSLFDANLASSDCLNQVLEEIGRRSGAEGLRLRSVSLTPPERGNGLERVHFSLEMETSYASATSFLRWIEDAPPVYHVHVVGLERGPGTALLRTSVTGYMYLPTDLPGEEEL